MGSKVKNEILKKSDRLVTRESNTGNIHSIQFPNRTEIGLDSPYFREGFQVYGNVSVSGSLLVSASDYINFGIATGTSGYGFRDNNGTLEFKNNVGLNPQWTSFGSGGSGNPGGSNTQVQFNDSSEFGGDANFTFNKTTNTLTVSNLSASLTRLPSGDSFIAAGNNVTISSSSAGQITVSATDNGSNVKSGSTDVGNVTQLDVTNLAVLSNQGAGVVALTGSIGNAEDGSYSDGLFTDFFSGTPVGTAIDRFNEVLKGLAPAAAPSLDDIDCNDSGADANLSFGSTQSISGYTNAQPSTLSSPASSLSDVNINGGYSSTTVSNDVRVACFAGATVIDGTLNADIAADSPNYAADSFGNGNQGILKLFVNNNSTEIHSVDLSSFGSGNSVNGNGSGFNLSATTPGHFSDGSNFDTFQHRQGTYTVATSDQRNGWNYLRVVHTISGVVTTCNYVEWANDSDNNALAAAGSALDTLSMTGLNTLSGVRYNTGGTAEYRVRVTNAYRNVYSQNNITFNGTNCSVSSQALPVIDYSNGENEQKVLHITGSATINSDPILDNSISVSVNVPHPLKSNISSGGSESISGILLYNLSNTSTSTSETFRLENYRKISGSYGSQSDVTNNSNDWTSSVHMSGTNTGYEDGLMFYNSRLRAPRQGANNGDFRNTSDGGSISNGPDENVNYSNISAGKRTFYRYFQNTAGGAKTDFRLSVNGSGTIVSQGTNLGTGNISVLAKLPTTSGNQVTGWMDLAVAFSTGQTGDGAGCLNGSFDSTLNATNDATFGTVFVDSNEYIMLKIEADASFTGNINTISVTWL